MNLIHLKEAAAKMGICYETFRRKRAMGVFRRIKFVRYGDKSREGVVLESVEEEIKLWTNREN